MSSKKKMKKFMGVVVTATGAVITGLAIIVRKKSGKCDERSEQSI